MDVTGEFQAWWQRNMRGHVFAGGISNFPTTEKEKGGTLKSLKF